MSDRSDQQPDTGDRKPASPGERIAKVLARAGIASRREAEEMVLAGRVRLNGRVVKTPAINVLPKDRIVVDGQELGPPEPPRLFRYHKPAGLVTTASDEKGRPTVFENLPAGLPRLMSVGRLDLTSEGLLLLTNDGELKRQLELPATGWLRKYRVRVHGTPDDSKLEILREGITIEGETFRPMEVTVDRQQGGNAWLTVGLREGRNREIRRAFAEIGLPVSRLIRISYGPFRLGDLARGAVEEVRPRIMREQLGGLLPDGGSTDPAVRSARDGAGARKATAPRRRAGQGADASVAGVRPAPARGSAGGRTGSESAGSGRAGEGGRSSAGGTGTGGSERAGSGRAGEGGRSSAGGTGTGGSRAGGPKRKSRSAAIAEPGGRRPRGPGGGHDSLPTGTPAGKPDESAAGKATGGRGGKAAAGRAGPTGAGGRGPSAHHAKGRGRNAPARKGKADGQPGGRTDAKPGGKPKGKPGGKPGGRTSGNPAANTPRGREGGAKRGPKGPGRVGTGGNGSGISGRAHDRAGQGRRPRGTTGKGPDQ